jgi:hypothetical protein
MSSLLHLVPNVEANIDSNPYHTTTRAMQLAESRSKCTAGVEKCRARHDRPSAIETIHDWFVIVEL